MTAATAHVLPLANARSHATHPEHMPTAAVFVARATASPLTDIRTVARVYSLTPAEARLVQQLIAGASLTEAATALGIGVSRRTDLLALITRLIPPVRRPH